MTRQRARSSLGVLVVLGAPLVFLSVFFVWPVVAILWRGLGDNPGAIPDVLGTRSTWEVLWFTSWQAAVSTVLTVLVALPLAGVTARFRFPGRLAVRALATIPFVLPTLVVATAFLALAERLGLDDGPLRLPGTVWAILAAHVFFNVAIVVRTVGGYWSQLDNRVEQAARTLGANAAQTFWLVTLPRLRSSIVSAASIVFLFSFTSFGVILILGGPRRATLDTEIWRYATQRTEFDTAAVLALLQLVTVGAALLLYRRLQGRVPAGERLGSPARLERRPRGVGEWSLVAGTVAGAGALLGLPLAILVERSLSTGDGYSLANYRALATRDGRVPLLPVPATEALFNSLSWAVLATLIATVIGGLAAYAGRGGAAGLMTVPFLLPLGTSAVVVGFGMLIGLDERPLDFRSQWWIVPVAHAVVGVPFVLRTVAVARDSIDERLREAAAALGAAPRRVRREVDMPLVARGMLIGAGFAFTVSLGEFGATAFLARPNRPTVPTAIFRLLGRPGEMAFGQAMALSVILAVVTAVTVLAMERLRGTVSGEF